MIPTSARRRIVIKTLIDYSTGWVAPRRRIEKKTTSQSSPKALSYTMCHGTPRPPRPHTPDHLQSSLTPSTYTLVSLRCTLHKLTQPHHSCHRTKLGSMSNFPGLCPYVLGHHLFVFFSICRICLMHFH